MPPWAVGKTNEEVLRMAREMADALATVSPQKPVAQPAAVAPNAQQPTMPNADDFTLDPVAATQRVLEYNVGQRYQPILDRMTAQLAGAGRQIAAMQYADDFRRWGPEIDQLVAPVAPDQRSAELYAQAVRLVKANHLDEIAAERADAKLASLGITDRTSAGGTVATLPSSAVDLTKLPAGYKAAMDNLGISQSELNEFLGKTRQTMEQFVESVNRKQVISDVQFDRKGRSQVVLDMDAMYKQSLDVAGQPVKVRDW